MKSFLIILAVIALLMTSSCAPHNQPYGVSPEQVTTDDQKHEHGMECGHVFVGGKWFPKPQQAKPWK